MIQLLLCSIGRHRHYRRRIKRGSDGLVRSECRGCGVPMVRDAEGKTWVVQAQ